MRVGEICNREVVVIDEQSSIVDAAGVMREYHVGDIVVIREKYGKQEPVGILTDRDIAIEIVARATDPQTVTVGDAMSFDLVTVTEDDDLMHTIEIMRDKGIRRIPVVGTDDALVGIVTVDDIVELLGEILIDINHLVGRQQLREQKTRP
jgi:CBS domain-containing protein